MAKKTVRRRVLQTVIRLMLSGGSFRAQGSKRQAERAFCNRVDIPVPETGLGPRLNWMTEWCRARIAVNAWDMHSHHIATRTGRAHVARFYFAASSDAEAFAKEWRTTFARKYEQASSFVPRTPSTLTACLGAQGGGLYAF